MKTLNKLFIAIVVSVFLGVPAIAQDGAKLFGLVTPMPDRAERADGEEVIPETILYSIDPDTGAATAIGATTGFTNCTGLDFEPGTNDLYAVCSRLEEEEIKLQVSPGEPEAVGFVLVKVDRNTGQAAEIGPLGFIGGKSDRITDISFRSDGVLFAHINASGPNKAVEPEVSSRINGIQGNSLGIIDTVTGQLTILGPTGSPDDAGAIGFSLRDILYLAASNELEDSLNVLNQNTGAAGFLNFLNYQPPINDYFNTVTSMDIQPIKGYTFASVQSEKFEPRDDNGDPIEYFLTTIEPRTGQVKVIGRTVDFLFAIAFLNEERVVVPTLSEWGLIALSGMLLLSGAFYLRRRVSA